MLTWTDCAGIAIAGFFAALIVALLHRPGASSAKPEAPPEECPTCGREFTVRAELDWRPKS